MQNFNFNNIVKNVLKESFNDLEYHFTGFNTAYEICKNNTIPLAPSLGKAAERGMNGNRLYFMSFTRRRNGKVGYSRGRNVRIAFDGTLLNQQFKAKAVDYWGDSMGKQSMYRKLYNYDEREQAKENDKKIPSIKYNNAQSPENLTRFGKKKDESDEDYQKRQEHEVYDAYNSQFESEDRLFTNKPYIENAFKYILSIDILIDPSKKNEIIQARNIYFTDFKKKVRIYDNEHDFNSINGKTINDKFEWEGEYNELGKHSLDDNTMYTRSYHGIDILADFFIFLYHNKFVDKKNIASTIRKMLQNGNLPYYERQINKILKEVEKGINNLWWTYTDTEYAKFFKLIQDAYEMRTEKGQEIVRFLTDWYKMQGFKSTQDFIKKLNYNINPNNLDLYDNQVKKKFLTYDNRIIILNPDTEDFWKVIGYNEDYEKEYITQPIENYVYENNIPIIGDEDKFHKYMQHIQRKCTVAQMIELLNKITGNAYEWLSNELGREFKVKTLDCFTAEYDYHLPGFGWKQRDKERQIIRNQFLK